MKSRIISVCVLLCGLFLIIGSGCNKCKGGCDVTLETTGAMLRTTSDTLLVPDPSYQTAPAHIYLLATNVSRSGGKGCDGGKALSICYNDAIDSNQIRVRCNGDLYLKDTTIRTGTNLLTIPSVTERKFGTTNQTNQTNLAALTLQAGPYFKAGRYTFLLDGITRDGKAFADTVYITWY